MTSSASTLLSAGPAADFPAPTVRPARFLACLSWFEASRARCCPLVFAPDRPFFAAMGKPTSRRAWFEYCAHRTIVPDGVGNVTCTGSDFELLQNLASHALKPAISPTLPAHRVPFQRTFGLIKAAFLVPRLVRQLHLAAYRGQMRTKEFFRDAFPAHRDASELLLYGEIVRP